MAAPTEDDAHKLMSVLTPWLAKLEEIVLVLNPQYNDSIQEVEELLVRMQYRFVNRKFVELSKKEIYELLIDKFTDE